VESLHANDVVGGSDAKVEPIQAESAHVDGAAGGSQDHNEADEVLDVPPLRNSKVFGIHAVPWNCDLRDVIEQVLCQELNGHHWLKRKPATCNQDAKNVAEVRGRDHFDVFNTNRG